MSSKRKNIDSYTLKLVKDQEILELKRTIEKLEKESLKLKNNYKKENTLINEELNIIKSGIKSLQYSISNILIMMHTFQEGSLQQNQYRTVLSQSMNFDEIKRNFDNLLKENKILLNNNCEISKILMKHHEDNISKQEKINSLEIQLKKVEFKSEKKISLLEEIIEKGIIDKNYANEINYLKNQINCANEIIDGLINDWQKFDYDKEENYKFIELNDSLMQDNKELHHSLNRICFA